MEKFISLAQVEQLIDEMIEKIKWTPIAEYMGNPAYHTLPAQQEILEDFKSKLSSLPTEESGWIAVDNQEFEPKEMIKHLIWYHDGIGIAAMDSGVWYDDFLNTPFGITHWMPLPKPPLQ